MKRNVIQSRSSLPLPNRYSVGGILRRASNEKYINYPQVLWKKKCLELFQRFGKVYDLDHYNELIKEIKLLPLPAQQYFEKNWDPIKYQ